MRGLRIYLLSMRNARHAWDETFAAAVIAANEQEARKLAAEYGEHFLDEKETSCEEVPFERGVIMTEFMNG